MRTKEWDDHDNPFLTVQNYAADEAEVVDEEEAYEADRNGEGDLDFVVGGNIVKDDDGDEDEDEDEDKEEEEWEGFPDEEEEQGSLNVV